MRAQAHLNEESKNVLSSVNTDIATLFAQVSDIKQQGRLAIMSSGFVLIDGGFYLLRFENIRHSEEESYIFDYFIKTIHDVEHGHGVATSHDGC